MFILAIDTSCDETSVAITEDDFVLSNIISSQTDLHKKYGGVVPFLAQRAHKENIDPAIKESIKRANISLSKLHKKKIELKDINVFAVTIGGGLAPALEVGIGKAKELVKKFNKPLIAINHVEGHIYANFRKIGNNPPSFKFPILCLLVSGKHTELVLMKGHGKYEMLGETLDDAAGEAFDKVARMIGLGYPGGAVIEKFAEEGDESKFPFPVPMTKSKNCDFSYSGLKTSVLYTVKRLGEDLSKKTICDISASFQKAAIEHLVEKTDYALRNIRSKPPSVVLLGGGVIANKEVRKRIRMVAKKYGLGILYPDPKKLCTDNAAMIAITAFYKSKRKEYVKNLNKLERKPLFPLS